MATAGSARGTADGPREERAGGPQPTPVLPRTVATLADVSVGADRRPIRLARSPPRQHCASPHPLVPGPDGRDGHPPDAAAVL